MIKLTPLLKENNLTYVSKIIRKPVRDIERFLNKNKKFHSGQLYNYLDLADDNEERKERGEEIVKAMKGDSKALKELSRLLKYFDKNSLYR